MSEVTTKDLKSNYKSFKANLDQSQKDQIAALKDGQSPKVLLITCSDSRINLEDALGYKPGEVFVIRNAGNFVSTQDSKGLGTVQYAVSVLGVEEVIICGHSGCGAVGGMLDMDSVKSLTDVHAWLDSCEGSLDPKCDVDTNVKQNVLNQLSNLNSLPYVKQRVESGDLKTYGWFLDLGTYDISSFDTESQSWSEIA